jgi:uncharacterized membrane protein YidH (DUF202 family)
MIAPSLDGNTAAHERTVLAWNRAALAIAGNGALLLHAGLSDRQSLVTVTGCVVGAIGALLWLISSAIGQSPTEHAVRSIAHYPRAVPLVAFFALSLSLIDFIVIAA